MTIKKAKEHAEKAIVELDTGLASGERLLEDPAEVRSYLGLACELMTEASPCQSFSTTSEPSPMYGEMTIDMLKEAVAVVAMKIDAMPERIYVSPARYQALVLLPPGPTMLKVAGLWTMGAQVIESSTLSDDEMIFIYPGDGGNGVKMKLIKMEANDENNPKGS